MYIRAKSENLVSYLVGALSPVNPNQKTYVPWKQASH